MNLDRLVAEVIPPVDYRLRNGFNNIPIIDKLNRSERQLLIKELELKLELEIHSDVDILLVDTLGYLKAQYLC